jgi:ubiquinone/menaquinone biosynthesis C-methylase UbiE
VSYGAHILSTGEEVHAWENVFGRYIYDSRFRGKHPVLDVGAGRCWFTRQDPSSIRGLDIEEEIVSHYRKEGLTIDCGSVYNIPFLDDTFAGVFCCWLLEHLTDPEAAIREIARVLKPGGYACVIVPSQRTLLRTFYDDYTHVRPFTKTSLTDLGRAGGFHSIRVSPLFWTRGGGLLSRHFALRTVYSYLNLADRVGRHLGFVNRDNLVLEGLK